MNAVLHIHGSDDIRHFIADCVRKGSLYIGSNCKVGGVKSKFYNVVWTADTTNPIMDSEGEIVGWDKRVSEMNPVANGEVGLADMDHLEYQEAFKIRKLLDKMSYQDVEDYINTNVVDLNSAKVFMIRQSKVILALAKIIDKESRR